MDPQPHPNLPWKVKEECRGGTFISYDGVLLGYHKTDARKALDMAREKMTDIDEKSFLIGHIYGNDTVVA